MQNDKWNPGWLFFSFHTPYSIHHLFLIATKLALIFFLKKKPTRDLLNPSPTTDYRWGTIKKIKKLEIQRWWRVFLYVSKILNTFGKLSHDTFFFLFSLKPKRNKEEAYNYTKPNTTYTQLFNVIVTANKHQYYNSILFIPMCIYILIYSYQ